MVVGSLAFAALRRGSLGLLLVFSTAAVGVGYLGMGAAPTLAVACAAAALGGTGNGVQWVSVVSAVQEMTSEAMQARVLSVLESSGAVMPALGWRRRARGPGDRRPPPRQGVDEAGLRAANGEISHC
jgi:hypothetical protein